MYRGHSVAVVVPAHNEEGLVGRVIDTMPSIVDRVYVIDDGSTDETWNEIRRHARRVNERRTTDVDADGPTPSDQFVVPMRHAENGGRGSCVKDGYEMALGAGFDVTAVMDGDGQMDPAELSRILDPVVSGAADYAKGTRLQRRDHVSGMSYWRLSGNVALSVLTNFASGYWGMADSQNGYTAISREALETIPLDEVCDGYGFLNDILTMLNIHDFRIAEVPHPAVYGDEESGIRYVSFIPMMLRLLLSNFLRRLRAQYVADGFHATVFCYLFGTLVMGAGVATILLGSQLLVPSVLLVGGIVLFLSGVVLDVQQNGDLTYRVDPHLETSRR